MYRVQLRSPNGEARRFWRRRLCMHDPLWGPGAWAMEYMTVVTATEVATRIHHEHGRVVDVVRKDGKVMKMWAESIQQRIDAAVAAAKTTIRAERAKCSWIGGVCPDYYRIPIPWLDVELSPFDLIEALELNFNRGCAVKYVLRAGRKTLDPVADLEKARNCIDREIARLKAASARD